jgi:hypothetical protein
VEVAVQPKGEFDGSPSALPANTPFSALITAHKPSR